MNRMNSRLPLLAAGLVGLISLVSILQPVDSMLPIYIQKIITAHPQLLAKVLPPPNPNDPAEVVNVINGRSFPEKYNRRCLKSTLVQLKDEDVPEMILLKGSEANEDKHLSFNATSEEILAAGFNPTLKTTIFIHGWTQSYTKSPYLVKTIDMIHRMRSGEKGNYFVFNWENAAQGGYQEVAARVGGVANYLTVFLERLIDDVQYDRMKVHLISHSIGVPLSAFAARRIRPPIGRITGLDPAAPCFGTYLLNGPDDMLMRGDAFQVDVYHYDLMLGNQLTSGDVSVYVNGGKQQPGCPTTSEAMMLGLMSVHKGETIPDEVWASHTRSALTATKQLIEGECQQVAYECSNYETFLKGKCASCGTTGESCHLMSLPYQYASHEDTSQELRKFLPQGKAFYLALADNDRYCSNQYQIVVTFEESELTARASESGLWKLQFKFTYEFENGERGTLEADVTERLSDNEFVHLLISENSKPYKIISAQLLAFGTFDMKLDSRGRMMIKHENLLDSEHKINRVDVNYLSNIKPEIKHKYSSRLCLSETHSEKKHFWGFKDSKTLSMDFKACE